MKEKMEDKSVGLVDERRRSFNWFSFAKLWTAEMEEKRTGKLLNRLLIENRKKL